MVLLDLNLPPCPSLGTEAVDCTSMDRRKRIHAHDPAAELGCCSAPESKRPNTQQGACPEARCGQSARFFPECTDVLRDRFRVSEGVLGQGQFGSVRQCWELGSGEALACKSIGKVQGSGAEAQGREVCAEVDVMRRLAGHENLVQLRGVLEDSEHVHLVMDLCAGGDLFDEVVRRGRFSEADAAHILAQLVRGVAFCHARGVLHRDLKPENILLPSPLCASQSVAHAAARGPVVKLGDLGLAVVLAPGQRMAGMAGSPFYMAPEVVQGEYDFAADVWSLGVILYILLCGSPPFWGPSDADVLQAILRARPDLASAPWDSVSADAKNLILTLLHPNPACRPPAHRILTHPWLVRHLAPRKAPVRRVLPHALPASPQSVV